MNNDTVRGKIRADIIDHAEDDQITVLPKKFFGEIHIIGEKHKEAAEYYRSKIQECTTKVTEISLHFEVEEKFGVAIVNCQQG